jgi:hypothetical protein
MRSLLANLVGRSWMYHQAIIYRRAALARVGSYDTRYRSTSDYDYHVRSYLHGWRAGFAKSVLVEYDMTGGSNDVTATFGELAKIHRAHRGALPPLISAANEIVRRLEHARIRAQRNLSATKLGAFVRPIWVAVNRRLRDRPPST